MHAQPQLRRRFKDTRRSENSFLPGRLLQAFRVHKLYSTIRLLTNQTSHNVAETLFLRLATLWYIVLLCCWFFKSLRFPSNPSKPFLQHLPSYFNCLYRKKVNQSKPSNTFSSLNACFTLLTLSSSLPSLFQPRGAFLRKTKLDYYTFLHGRFLKVKPNE